jgi:hypothetical protein
MTVHIIKLSVGSDSVEDIAGWHQWQVRQRILAGLDPRPVCDTRNTPKRAAEIIGQGSLYWVVKGMVLARQKIVDIRTLGDEGGPPRCEIVLDAAYVRVMPRRQKAFQGWRYLSASDAPPDVDVTQTGADMPDGLREQLLELGAW